MVTTQCVCTFTLIGVLLGSIECAHGQALSCPAVLPQTRQHTVELPPGWDSYERARKHTLETVMINFGDPRKGSDGALPDERTVKTDAAGVKIETTTWKLIGLQNPYLVCGYFGTSVALLRSLTGLSQCTLISARVPGSSRPEIRSAVCS
jgi:hypothetical protein